LGRIREGGIHLKGTERARSQKGSVAETFEGGGNQTARDEEKDLRVRRYVRDQKSSDIKGLREGERRARRKIKGKTKQQKRNIGESLAEGKTGRIIRKGQAITTHGRWQEQIGREEKGTE